GLLHTLMGEEYIKKHFAVSGLMSTIKAAIFGVPLPVCSCGVIPLAESLRKDGASKSATMSFLVSTPSSGVDSILATYALLGPVYAVFRPIASFVSGILVGIVTHFQEKKELRNPVATAEAILPKQKKVKSVKGVLVYGFKVIPGELAKWLILGVLIGGAISAAVPADFVSRYLGSPLMNYVVILLISIPLYVCATGSIPIAASLIAKGILPGAALAFLIAGPATNTVTISFLFKKMGAKITAIYIFSIALVSVASGLLFDYMWANWHMKFSHTAAHAGHGEHTNIFGLVSAVVMTIVFINCKFDIFKFIGKLWNKEQTMENVVKVNVPDMTCQHCKMKIENLLGNDPKIESVSIDLGNRDVQIQTTLPKQAILDIIKAEGYNPV
ncbi:MAG: hypothetical protein GY765_43680, partial [bacterium]|nr:hypothetical protein [bacterium]